MFQIQILKNKQNKDKTLATLIDKENNFLVMRFFAAIFVIITHSYPILGSEEVDWLYRFTDSYSLSDMGLICFFFISGLLVTKSLHFSTSYKNYLWKRFLRLFPGLFCLYLIVPFVLGPLVAACSLAEYFSAPAFWSYLKGATLLKIEYYIPCLFAGNPLGSVNASLWTLPLEFKLYILLLIAAVLGLLKRRFLVLVLVFALVLVSSFFYKPFYELFDGLPFIQARLWTYFKYGTYFGIGSVAFLFREQIKMNAWLAFALLVFWLLTMALGSPRYFDFFIFPYILLYLAFIDTGRLQRFFPKGDYSYGLYIYAYPLQQILVQYFGSQLNETTMIWASILIAFVFAYFSWHFVEKKALKLKGKVA